VFSIAALLEPDPGAELRAVAARLLGEAVEIERAAAAACGAALRDLAARAPASSRWASTSRFLGDVAQSVGGAAAGLAGVIGSGVHALPFVGNGRGRHNARHELAESALAMMRVWETPVEMWQAVMDDRAGLTAGTFAAAALPVGKFRIHNPNLAHREALAEAARRSILQGHVQTTPSISTLLRDGVSLVNEEARGGHAWSRHVAKPRSFLAYRTRGGIPKAGTFRDLPTAERLVNTVLREHADRLHEVYALRGRARLTLISEFPFTTGRVTVVGSSRTLPAKAVKVVLVLQDGDPLVYTAFPEL
jgi:hypothetical protein